MKFKYILFSLLIIFNLFSCKPGITDTDDDTDTGGDTITVEIPVATPPAGIYTEAQSITLACETEGADIFFTLDDSAPTAASTQYSDPISIDTTTTLKAIAIKDGELSGVLSAVYTIDPFATVVAAPQANYPEGTYTETIFVTLTSATEGADIHYTTNGNAPTVRSAIYSAPLEINSTTTIRAFAVKEGLANSGSLRVVYTFPPVTAMPVASPPAGAYLKAQNVTLTSATPDAVIYYTTNGSEPTTASSVYSAPIAVDTQTTIKALAVKEGLIDSSILNAQYTFFTLEDAEDNPFAFAASMKIGWNLGNTFDAHSNMNPNFQWGNPAPTQALINAVKAQGFGAVRIPVTWGTKVGSAPNYTIESGYLAQIESAVNMVLEAGMKAIINIHHDGADSSYWLSVRRDALTTAGKAAVDAQLTAMWAQIAEHFKDHNNNLVFEGFNEIHDGNWGYTNTSVHGGVTVVTNATDLANQYARVKEFNQLFVNAVRAASGEYNKNRFLVVSGLVTRPSLLNPGGTSQFSLPTDSATDRLILNFHYYDPYDFSGSASWNTWGSKANTSSTNNWANESHVQTQLNNVKNWHPNIPVIIGEYGAVRQSSTTGKAHRLYYLEYITKSAIDLGFIPFYWDNGAANNGSEGFGLFNRTTNALLTDAQDVINVLMKAANEDYLLSSITAP